jgi:hypothetical protein
LADGWGYRDVVNGSTVLWAKNEVSKDIEKLAELIRK